MRWLLISLLVGCASPVKSVPEAPLPVIAPKAVRPEPSFSAKRLGGESGALLVAEVRFLGGESTLGPLALHDLDKPAEAVRAQVIAWADAPYGQGDVSLAKARADVICERLKPLVCEPYNMAEKAGLFSRALFFRSARVKAAAAAAAPEEASRAIVLFFK